MVHRLLAHRPPRIFKIKMTTPNPYADTLAHALITSDFIAPRRRGN